MLKFALGFGLATAIAGDNKEGLVAVAYLMLAISIPFAISVTAWAWKLRRDRLSRQHNC